MKNIIIASIVLLFSSNIIAQTEATTKDGRKVILNDDLTYSWVKVEEQTEKTSSVVGGEYYIEKQVDDMTDKVYYGPSKSLILQDKVSGKGFRLGFNFDGKTDESLKIGGLSAKVIGLDCLEKTIFFFLFEDDTKLSITSWNKFNCKGNAWYNLTESQTKELSTKAIKKIRVQNGRNFKTYTHTLESTDKNYFINMYKGFEAKDIRLKEK